MYDNCPFKNGNGYGDGRAVSIGEVVVAGAEIDAPMGEGALGEAMVAMNCATLTVNGNPGF